MLCWQLVQPATTEGGQDGMTELRQKQLLKSLVADELWLENNQGKYKFERCQEIAPVIEVIKRLK
jgi:hypothetical protein